MTFHLFIKTSVTISDTKLSPFPIFLFCGEGDSYEGNAKVMGNQVSQRGTLRIECNKSRMHTYFRMFVLVEVRNQQILYLQSRGHSFLTTIAKEKHGL